MQPPLTPPQLSLSAQAALIEALTKGGMPSLFFPSVITVVESLVAEAVRADRLRQQGDPFARGCVR